MYDIFSVWYVVYPDIGDIDGKQVTVYIVIIWAWEFSRRMTDHLEIKNVLSWAFLEKSGIPRNFLFHAK